MSALYINVQGLINNYKDLDEQKITLQGYDNIGSVSTSSRTGGVIKYCKKNWSVKKFIERTDELQYWILFCTAVHNYNYHNILIGAIYRFQRIEEISDNNWGILFAGDFSIDWKRNSVYKNRIKNTLTDNGLKQIINECTRVTKISSTIIDYIITNNYKIKCTYSKDNKISDHEVINIDFERPIENILRTTKAIKIF